LYEDPRTKRQVEDIYDDWLHEKSGESLSTISDLENLAMFYDGDMDNVWIGKTVCELTTKGLNSSLNILSLIEEDCFEEFRGYVKELLSSKGIEIDEEEELRMFLM